MRRLYSTFAPGWPGIGLLILRFVIGSALLIPLKTTIWSLTPIDSAVVKILLALCGLLLLAGLWTPIVGIFVAVSELWRCGLSTADPATSILLASMSCALAMLGPGVWSVDARLFGWRRVHVPAPFSGGRRD